jgi:hypothetical protein
MSWLLTAGALFLLLDAHKSTGAAASSVVNQLQKPARSSRLDQYLRRASSVQAAADDAAAAAAPLRFGDVRALSKVLEQYDQQRHRLQSQQWTNDDEGAVSVLQALAQEQRNRQPVLGEGLYGPARVGVKIQGVRRQLGYGLLPAEAAVVDESVAPRQGRSTSRYADQMDAIARTLTGNNLYAPEDDEDDSEDYEENDDEEDEEEADGGRSFLTSQQQRQQPQQQQQQQQLGKEHGMRYPVHTWRRRIR